MTVKFAKLTVLVCLFALIVFFQFVAVACTAYTLTNIAGAYEANKVTAKRIASYGLEVGLFLSELQLLLLAGLPIVLYWFVQKVFRGHGCLRVVAFVLCCCWLIFLLSVFIVDAGNDLFYILFCQVRS